MASKVPRSQAFLGAVENVLNNWTALQLAVQHQLGGPDSRAIAQWMIGVVENLFYESNDGLQGWEVGDYLGEIIQNEFNTECEDGSLEEIGNLLCKLFEMAKNGKEEELKQELLKLHSCNLDLCKPLTPSEPSSDNIDSSMSALRLDSAESEAQPSKSKNEPDEDGWVTVTKRK